MDTTFDPARRAWTLAERGLDFARSQEIFDGTEVSTEDKRAKYGETRWVTVGYLDDRMVVVI